MTTDPILLKEYNKVIDTGWESGWPTHFTICAIHEHKTLEGLDLLPKELLCDLREHLEYYRKTGVYKVGSSSGEFDHSEKMQTVEMLFRKAGISS